MPTTPHLLKPERRRALELLAPCRDGCTETTMLAQGFSIDMMIELIRSSGAGAQPMHHRSRTRAAAMAVGR